MKLFIVRIKWNQKRREKGIIMSNTKEIKRKKKKRPLEKKSNQVGFMFSL